MKYSVVIPIHNEQDLISEVVTSVDCVIRQTLNEHDYEIIVVDDKSQDKSLEVCLNLKKQIPVLTVISLKNWQKKSFALQVGFIESKGDTIITLDGDNQDVAEEIPKLLEKFNSGFDFVIGFRHKRQDLIYKRIVSRFANKIMEIISGVKLHDMGCNLRVFKKKIVEKIFLDEGIHRYLAIIAAIEGYSVVEVTVSHRERKSGKSKYNTFNRASNTIRNILQFCLSGKGYWKKKVSDNFSDLYTRY